jgi:hypothetical protein
VVVLRGGVAECWVGTIAVIGPVSNEMLVGAHLG